VKRKTLRLSVLFTCVLIGWVLGYLRLPYIEKNHSFWIGFLACLGLVLFLVLLRIIWNNNAFLFKWISNNQATSDSKSAAKTYISVWTSISVIFIAGALVVGFMMQRQNKLFENQTKTQDLRILELSEMTESLRKSNQGFFMSNILDKVDDEVKNSTRRTLSDETIARIAALSYSFKPYRYFEGDTLSVKKLSPERGQLLLTLVLINMDTTSFAKIKRSTSFAMADLRGANLKGAELSGIDLNEANLEYADLNEANLSGANLSKANLLGTKLNKTNLSSAHLRTAYMGWAEMNDANLHKANLNGANLENAQMIGADLSESIIQYSFLIGAILKDANFTGSDLVRSNLKRANLTNANLTDVRFFKVVVDEAIFNGTTMTHAEVHEEWLEQFNQSQVAGAKELLIKYHVVGDSSISDQPIKYYLEKSE
jgi:uncharacterized protein YjbI with pentapeptide repeats